MKRTIFDIIKGMQDRLPYLSKNDINYYALVIIGLMRKRLIENKPVIIDGFGVLLRKSKNFIIYQDFLKARGFSITNKSVAQLVKFYPHFDLLKMRDIIGKDFIKHLVMKNEKLRQQKVDKRKSWFKTKNEKK